MAVNSVLERSFVMIQGIGLKREEQLWKNGITDFDEFTDATALPGISQDLTPILKERANEAKRRILLNDREWIADALPEQEKWRMLSLVGDRSVALDVECAKINRTIAPVLVSVCRRGKGCTTLIRGEDLYWDRLAKLLHGTDILLTFNGSSFDLPLLRRCGFKLDGFIHLDLRRFSRRAGLAGGLKRIERTMGIRRPRELEYSTGSQASYLWNLWASRGSRRAIDLLIDYNRRDAESLFPLSYMIYHRLRTKRLMCIDGYART
ncbi:MAG: ribonuclease H-like domain-containing protein [Thermoplasmata archaeon]